MSQELYYAGEVALWLQRDCGDAWEFLGCHNLTGVSVPKGDTNASYCRTGKNVYDIKRTWKGTPGLGSATVVAYDTVLNLIQELPCPFYLFALHSACGADDDPKNYDYLYMYEGIEPTSEDTDTHVSGMSADDQTEITLSFPVSFKKRYKVKGLTAQTRELSVATDLESVWFCDEPECGNLCGNKSVGCQTGFFVGDNGVIKLTEDGGGSFSTVSSPFTTGTDPISVVRCSGDLVIVVDGTATSYAYSWDGGTTWTEVTTLTKLINDVFVMGGTKIWAVAQGGYVYFSSDRGASFSVQDAGAATTYSLNAVSFSDSLKGYAVGDTNSFIRTSDGGEIWEAVTGPAPAVVNNDLYSVAAVSGSDVVFIGDESGNLYRSEDNGDNWTTVFASVTSSAGGVVGIAAPHCNIVAIIINDEDPYWYSGATVDGLMYQTIDGGNSWNSIELPANDGLNAIYACDHNKYWIVGEDGFAAVVSGPSI